jgi:hypothetical protein
MDGWLVCLFVCLFIKKHKYIPEHKRISKKKVENRKRGAGARRLARTPSHLPREARGLLWFGDFQGGCPCRAVVCSFIHS